MDFLRWHVSLDLDDMASLLAAFVALVSVFVWKRSYNKQRTVMETVDAPVLAKFLELTDEVASLRVEVESARREIQSLREELSTRTKEEEFLRGVIHARDKEIEELRCELRKNKARIQHLEDVIRDSGLNGDTVVPRRKV